MKQLTHASKTERIRLPVQNICYTNIVGNRSNTVTQTAFKTFRKLGSVHNRCGNVVRKTRSMS